MTCVLVMADWDGTGSLVVKTCKDVTVVDYVILLPSLFPYVSEFEVLPFDSLISDAHNGIYFSLICNKIN